MVQDAGQQAYFETYARVLEHPDRVLVKAREPMIESNPVHKERTDKELIEDISHLKRILLGKETAICDECGKHILEGESVTVDVIRPPNASTYNVSKITCETHHLNLLDEFETEARELIVRGRVGWCSDQATQSSWPVLVAPRVYVVSRSGEESGYIVPAELRDGGKRALEPIPNFERTQPEPVIVDTVEHCAKRRRGPRRQKTVFQTRWEGHSNTDDCAGQQGDRGQR